MRVHGRGIHHVSHDGVGARLRIALKLAIPIMTAPRRKGQRTCGTVRRLFHFSIAPCAKDAPGLAVAFGNAPRRRRVSLLPMCQMSSIPPARPFFAQRVVPLSRPSPNKRSSIRSPSTKLHFALTQKPAFDRFRSVPWTIAPSPRAIRQGSLVDTRSGRFGNSLIVRFQTKARRLGPRCLRCTLGLDRSGSI